MDVSAQPVSLDDLMAQVVVHGDTLYLSGQVSESGAQSFSAQMSDVLHAIDRHLERFRSSRASLLCATIYLTNRGDLRVMNALWSDWLSGFRKPARTTVIAELIDPSWLVEISVIAVRATVGAADARTPGYLVK